MDGHDIIVVGASAGGVEALTTLVGDLPAGFPASVFIVLHVPPSASSALPRILARRGKLPVAHAEDGEAVERGRVYVAPPDRHLMVAADGTVRVVAGPKENGHRPSVDTLFRSAAHAYGRRAVAVVLSGSLADGTAGLRAVTAGGGVGIVQEPEEALYSGMPCNAIDGDDPDYVLPVGEIGKMLAWLASAPVTSEAEPGTSPPATDTTAVADGHGEEAIGAHPGMSDPAGRVPHRPSAFACPECHGVLWELTDVRESPFRCRVGHGFSPESLASQQALEVEGALWTAYRALEERAALCRRLAGRAAERGHRHSHADFRRQADDAEARAAVLRRVLHATGAPDVADEDHDRTEPGTREGDTAVAG